jgi:hypothetical protein
MNGRASPGSLPAGLALALLLLIPACDLLRERPLVLPDADDAAARYSPEATAEVRGNLLQITIPMDAEILRRGGAVWARSGPYFYIFSPATQALFFEYPDLAAVRVITMTEDGEEVARADLHRDTLSEVRWREALARSALAQRDGTDRPSTLLALTRFGEDNTEYEYNPTYAGE